MMGSIESINFQSKVLILKSVWNPSIENPNGSTEVPHLEESEEIWLKPKFTNILSGLNSKAKY